MTPDRTATINGHKVSEYYWAGEYVTYLDNQLQRDKSFEDVCRDLASADREEAA